MRDAYLRLSAQRPVSYGPAIEPGGLLFVDLEPGGDLLGLRDAPYELLARVREVVVRAPSPVPNPQGRVRLPSALQGPIGLAGSALAHGARVLGAPNPFPEAAERKTSAEDPDGSDSGGLLDELAGLLDALDVSVESGVVHQPVGGSSWVEGSVTDAQDVLARARAVELEALLEWGHAVWKPTTYHYLLPSGEHAAAFIKAADAIRTPRDSEVLASWLYPFARAGLGVVVDNGTLTAVIQALFTAMARYGFEPGPVAVLDGYPATYVDVARAVRTCARHGEVLALLSVNSSGIVRDRLAAALRAIGPGVPGRIEILIDKNPIAAHDDRIDGVAVTTWHPRPGAEPRVAYRSRSGQRCELCRDPARSRLIPINPRTFDGTIKAALRRVTPLVTDADANRRFWEFCNTIPGALSLEAEPDEPAKSRRPPGARMPLKFNLGPLVASEEFRFAASERIEKLMASCDATAAPTLVLMPQHEFELAGSGDVLVASLRRCLGTPRTVLPFPDRGRWDDELIAAVREHERVAVLALGSVTGGQLQQALVAVQHARGPGDYELTGFILHARPEEQRAWDALVNSYAGRLYWAWQTYLPRRSPLRDEASILEGSPEAPISKPGEDAEEFIERRRRFITGEIPPDEESVFWGSEPGDRLTPNSIFGQELAPAQVLAAVGSAMERARKQSEERAAPERRVFEMSAIVRSYYDPLIIAAVLRWLQPHEAWWGWDPEEGGGIVLDLLSRTNEPKDLQILTSELLLAGAQGKLVASAIKAVRAKAVTLTTNADGPGEAPIRVGLTMAPTYRTADEDRARGGDAPASRRLAAQDLIDELAAPRADDPPLA